MKKTDIENLSSKIDAFKRGQQALASNEDNSSHGNVSNGFQFMIEFLSAVFVAMAIGLFLDKLWHTMPVFLVVFTVLGSLAGVLNVYRFAKAREKESM